MNKLSTLKQLSSFTNLKVIKFNVKIGFSFPFWNNEKLDKNYKISYRTTFRYSFEEMESSILA